LRLSSSQWLDPEHDCDWHAHYKAALPPVNEKRKELTEKIGALEFDLAEARAGYHELDKNWNYLHDMSIGMFRSALDMPEATIPEMCARIQANRLGRAPDPNAEIESLKTQIREAREHLIAALDGDSANSKLPLIELIEMLELDLECEWERAEAAEKASGHE